MGGTKLTQKRTSEKLHGGLGSITQLDAIRDLGVFELSARIMEAGKAECRY